MRSCNRALAAGAMLSLLAGCPIGNNKYPKPQDLSPAWRIDKLRILAMTAEPPEIRPGESTRMSALIVDPNGTQAVAAWLACPTDGGGIGFGCNIDASFDFENATLEELSEAGFIGFEPFLPPVYTAPTNILDGLDERSATEGVYVTVTLSVLPQEVLDGGIEGDSFDFSKVQVAYKRVIVSEDATPNRNPYIRRFSVDGFPIEPGTLLEVDPGQPYEIGVELEEDAIEDYLYKGPDGIWQQRVEEPYVHWYTDAGDLTEEITLHPYLQASWFAPDPSAERDEGEPAPKSQGTFWAVIRDRRGGISWASLAWRLRGSAAP